MRVSIPSSLELTVCDGRPASLPPEFAPVVVRCQTEYRVGYRSGSRWILGGLPCLIDRGDQWTLLDSLPDGLESFLAIEKTASLPAPAFRYF